MSNQKDKPLPVAEKKHNASFTVHIIESPSPDDFLENRCEGALLCDALKLANIDTDITTVVNMNSLKTAMQSIQAKVENPNGTPAIPILHVSAHGNKNGIGLTQDDQRVKWHELAALIDPLHEACNNALIVSMSTCMGYNGFFMSIRTKEPPYFALIGPRKSPTWSDTLVAYLAFYHNLIVQRNKIPAAVKAMNFAAGKNKDFFGFSEGKKTKENFQKMVEKITKKVIKEKLQEIRANN